MKNIGVIAGDLRQHYIVSHLCANGYPAKYLYNFRESSVYVVPVPFTRDGININSMLKNTLTIDDFIASLKEGDIIFGGNIPKNFIDEVSKLNVTCHDFMKDSDVVWKNAYLTAEGLLAAIIESTSFSLKNANIFIIGYGRCGSLTAKLLKPLCNDIYIYDHTPAHLHELETNGYIPLKFHQIEKYMPTFDIAINTVPTSVLTERHYELADSECIFYEIASAPYGFNNEKIVKHNLRLVTCPGIPGKSSPKTAGEIISTNIIEHLERTEINEP